MYPTSQSSNRQPFSFLIQMNLSTESSLILGLELNHNIGFDDGHNDVTLAVVDFHARVTKL